jgi:hypothetical protein
MQLFIPRLWPSGAFMLTPDLGGAASQDLPSRSLSTLTKHLERKYDSDHTINKETALNKPHDPGKSHFTRRFGAQLQDIFPQPANHELKPAQRRMF